MTINAQPVPRRDPNVCEICRNPTTGYKRCYSCNEVTKVLGLGSAHPVPRVFPLGLAVKKSPLAVALWEYKRSDNRRTAVRAHADLREFIDVRLPHVMSHIGPVDAFTFVPGRRSSGSPVRTLVESSSWAGAVRVEEILEVVEFDLDTHVPDTDRFRSDPVPGQHVLLFDDTFTRGATSLSAALALYRAGASRVTIVVFGRHQDRGWLGEEYLAKVEERRVAGKLCPEYE